MNDIREESMKTNLLKTKTKTKKNYVRDTMYGVKSRYR